MQGFGGLATRKRKSLAYLESNSVKVLPYTLSESRVVFADLRDYYNSVRPHRSLGLQRPSEFAGKPSHSQWASLRGPNQPTKQHQHSEDIS